VKKFIASLLAVVGIAANADPKPEMVDVNSILYSMPTMSGDSIEYVIPTEGSFEGAPQFHEDEWSQLEFYPRVRLEEIQQKLIEYKVFEAKSRVASGWKKIYLRKISRGKFKADINILGKLEGAHVLPAPILTTASRALGQVKGGFTVTIGEGALLYGVIENDSIISLAASVHSDQGNNALTTAFMSLDKTEELILVDWRGQMIITGSSDGKLGVWKP
jgi:hypothetical protein